MATGNVNPKAGKILDLPSNAPTIGTASDGGTGTSATVAFTAPSTAVGGPIFSYTAVSNPGSITGTGTSSPITVSGLTTGTSYTFTVAGTNPTGSGPYSSASNSVTPVITTVYESIATVTVGSGGSSSIDFTSIPSTYKHLQIRGFYKGGDNAYGQFNGDTGSNYKSHYILGYSGTIIANVGGNPPNYVFIGRSSTNQFGSFVCDILDYTDTNKYKVTRSLAGWDNNGSGEVQPSSGLWMNTNAITSIKLYGPTSFTQYSSFALYGIRG